MEVEIRAKLKDKSEIISKLKKIGWIQGDEIRQKDMYYVHETQVDEVRGPGHYLLRIRQSPKGNFLTFKGLTDQKGTSIEYETEISNFEEMREILLKLGFIESVVIDKRRIKGKIEDMEICIDDFDEIGPYIECEIISDDKSVATGRIVSFLKSIGVSEDEFEFRGYGRIFSEMVGVKYSAK